MAALVYVVAICSYLNSLRRVLFMDDYGLFNIQTSERCRNTSQTLVALCSCGGNHGKAAMIECKDKLTYALIALMSLIDIKNERGR